MVEEEAIVTQVKDQQAWLKPTQTGGCKACLQQSTCGTSILSGLLPKREFAVDSNLALQVGDRVIVAVDDSQLLLCSFLLYLVPLLVMIVVVILSSSLLPPVLVEDWQPVIAITSLLLCFYLIHRTQPFLLFYTGSQPQVIAKKVK